MLLYKTKFRVSTLVVKIFISLLAIVLFLTGLTAVVGMLLAKQSDTGAVVFVFMTISVAIIIFKSSGWNIRAFLIYDDRLEIRILGGLRKISYASTTMRAFNDLKVLVGSRDSGIGIITSDHKMIRVVELDIVDFPVFIEHLQKIVRWDLLLTYDPKGT